MGITPLVFTGVSQFSDDFQTILNRSVAIASLPLQEMQNEQADLLVRKQLLSDLRVAVGDLAANVAALGTVGEREAINVLSSNSNRVSVTLSGTTAPGSYTISEITSVARAASETTATGYATADGTTVSSSGAVQLVVGSSTYNIELDADHNNLNGLGDAINDFGAGVRATVLNTGTGDTPYYLSITATASGETTLQLRDVPDDPETNLLTATNQGANAVFKLDGLSINKPDNVITGVIPGLSFTIVSTTGVDETVTLTAASNRGDLASALSNLVSSYNTVRDKVNAQIGETAGLLSGDFIVRQIQSSMRELTSYRGTGSISSLMDLGIELDDKGVMSLDQSKFYSLSNSEISAAFDFLCSPTAGFGALSASFTQISDPITGLINTQQNQYDVADERLNQQIQDLTARIDLMQAGLSLKLQQADVLLAQLESQQILLDASIQSLNYALYGKQDPYSNF
jgi:flagellar hook-associated protein 2